MQLPPSPIPATMPRSADRRAASVAGDDTATAESLAKYSDRRGPPTSPQSWCASGAGSDAAGDMRLSLRRPLRFSSSAKYAAAAAESGAAELLRKLHQHTLWVRVEAAQAPSDAVHEEDNHYAIAAVATVSFGTGCANKTGTGAAVGAGKGAVVAGSAAGTAVGAAAGAAIGATQGCARRSHWTRRRALSIARLHRQPFSRNESLPGEIPAGFLFSQRCALAWAALIIPESASRT